MTIIRLQEGFRREDRMSYLQLGGTSWRRRSGMFKKEAIGNQVDVFVGIVGKGGKSMLQIGKSRLRPVSDGMGRAAFLYL